MHGKRFGRHIALGIDVAVKSLAGRHAVDDLDAADLDQAVAAQRSRPVVSVSRTISRMDVWVRR